MKLGKLPLALLTAFTFASAENNVSINKSLYFNVSGYLSDNRKMIKYCLEKQGVLSTECIYFQKNLDEIVSTEIVCRDLDTDVNTSQLKTCIEQKNSNTFTLKEGLTLD
jgi:hypothetical protein